MLEEKYQKTIVVAIAIQKEGQATLEEINEKIQEMFKKGFVPFSLTPKQIVRECNKLQKKSLISTNYINEDGRQVLAYSPAKPLFARGIEGMRFMDIVDEETAKPIIAELDEKKGANKGREPDICHYYKVYVKWKVIDEFGVLGFVSRTKQGYLEHYRDAKGDIIILPKHFRSYIRENQRLINKTNFHNYVVFDYGKVTLNDKKTTKIDNSVIDGKQGRGFITYEVLPYGTLIETTFKVPKKGGLDEKTFEYFLRTIGTEPLRGLSGASSQGYGRIEVVEFKVL